MKENVELNEIGMSADYKTPTRNQAVRVNPEIAPLHRRATRPFNLLTLGYAPTTQARRNLSTALAAADDTQNDFQPGAPRRG